METWMILQGLSALGALGALVASAVALWKRRFRLAGPALVVSAVFGFFALNATAFAGPEVGADDDFDAEFDADFDANFDDELGDDFDDEFDDEP